MEREERTEESWVEDALLRGGASHNAIPEKLPVLATSSVKSATKR